MAIVDFGDLNRHWAWDATGTYVPEQADRAITFIKGLKHTKGIYAGRPFDLKPWQEAPLRELFGRMNAEGSRQYRTAYWEEPRKNGKSEIGAAVALKLLFADSEPGAEVYGAAEDRDQAALVFNVAVQMIRQTPELEDRCKIVESQRRILRRNPKTKALDGAFYRVIAADAPGSHGFNAHGVIFDELHTQPSRELWDVLTTSGGTRRQPLVFAMSTAGFDRKSICWEQHDWLVKIMKGIVSDPTFFGVLYFAPDEADWTDEKVWYEANPALGDFRSIDEMRSLFVKARDNPALQNTFRRLYLNQWTRQDTRWMDLSKWDAAAGSVYSSQLKKQPVYVGVDLASTNDLAAVCLVFPRGDHYEAMWRFYIPGENVHARVVKDRVPYDAWIQQGVITPTQGNVIDLEFIETELLNLRREYNVREVAFDPWQALEMQQKLQSAGMNVRTVPQTTAGMGPATAELMNLVLAHRIHHASNPVARWMADNMVVKQDSNGNVKPDKAKSTEKIDGMVALILALDGAMRNPRHRSVYEERGLRRV